MIESEQQWANPSGKKKQRGFKKLKNFRLRRGSAVLGKCWLILGHFWKEIVFLKRWVKLKKIWNVEDLMDLENRNLNWRISRWTPNLPLPTWGSLLGGGINCLVVIPTHFNPNNSLLNYFKFTPFQVDPAFKTLSTLLTWDFPVKGLPSTLIRTNPNKFFPENATFLLHSGKHKSF